MELAFKIISSPGVGDTDTQMRDFIAANDTDFYPTIASRKDLTEFIEQVYVHKGQFILCYDEDRIVGLKSFYLDHPSYITYYQYCAIDKGYRGKGISTVLFNKVHEICRENGVQWATVKTWSANTVSQAMFRRHGFFHTYTIEDDRGKGIHTYFFAKSFSQPWFKIPLTRLAIIGGNNNYALANFINTIAGIPKTISPGQPPLPFIAVSDCNDIPSAIRQIDASHIFVLESIKVASLHQGELQTNAEVIDLALITKSMVAERKKKFMLVAEEGSVAGAYFVGGNVHVPGADLQTRINDIVREIRNGIVLPAYHKTEIAAIAVLAGCEGVVLGTAALHTMFGFDKMFDGVEVFDPWLELAIIMQHSRMETGS